MSRFPKALFLMSAAIAALTACSGDKGPGEIGSKDDIIVKNRDMPAQTMKAEGEDFSSTVEQAQAVPAPEVEQAQAATAQAPEEGVMQDAASMPADQAAQPAYAETAGGVMADPAQMAAPASDPAAPTPTAEAPAPQAAFEGAAPAPQAQSVASPVYPAEPQPAMDTAPPAEASAQATAVSPAQATPAAQAPAQTTAAVPDSAIPYPLDPNAPYSPKAIEEAKAKAAAAAAGTPVTPPVMSASGINLADPAIIRSVQAALAAKSLYVGPQTGMMDAELLNVVTRYQAENNLPVGGLNEETLRHLGLIE